MKSFSLKTRRVVSPKRRSAQLRMEALEDRLVLSGFGPEDGAYIVEDRAGGDYRDVQIQPGSQAIFAVGDPGVGSDFGVARYDSLGNLDTSYGNAGLASPPLGPGWDVALALVLQQDGKAVVAGSVYIPGSVDLLLARLNPDGSPDAGFGAGGWTGFSVQPGSDTAYAVGLQSTGKIVVSGSSYSTSSASSGTWFVARFEADGAIDSGTGGFGQLAGKGKNAAPTGYALGSFGIDVAVQPDDRLVAVGGVNGQLAVARYTTSGTLDRTFNGNGSVVLSPTGISSTSSSGVALQADGKIIVVGIAAGIDGWDDMIVARFTAAGALDTSFAGGVGYVRLDIDGTASQTQERARDVEIQPDGKIVVVGNLQGADVVGKVMVARLNANGTLDSTFGVGGVKLGSPLAGTGSLGFFAYAIALQSNGNIIVAGHDNFGTTGDTNRPMLMRFFGSPASPLQAADGAALAPSHTKPPTLAQVQPLLTEAIARWQATGANVSALGDLDIRITDLGAATVGLASGSTIWLDDNAAGWGWFVDATPWDESEFTKPGNQGENDRMDLLTVIAHEVGHLLGFDHSQDGVMDDTLDIGIRTMPAGGNVLTEPAVVDSILAVDWTGQDHRQRDGVVESLSALFRRSNRFGLGRGNTLRR